MDPQPIKIISIDRLERALSHNTFPYNSFSSVVGDNSQISLQSFQLLCDTQNLLFSVITPPSSNYDRNLQSNQYHADLWKKDVIEIFLCKSDDRSYQEFNFAPTGAYWSARFSDYRNAIPESMSPIKNIKVNVSRSPDAQCITTIIPFSSILDGNGLKNCRINCCSIFGRNPRSYLSSSNLNINKPDFHDIATWRPCLLAENS